MVDIGVMLPTMSVRDRAPGDVAAAARHAEELGFESVWVADQLIAGTGTPVLDSLISLAAATAVTERVRLGLGVLVVPLRPVAWVAKQVASLQHLSDDRLLLGVGVGGNRHDRSWAAVDVPARERGARTEDALRILPDLISGKPTRLSNASGEATVQLSPPATVPPIIVGGMSDAAAERAATHDGWFVLGGAEQISAAQAQLEPLLQAAGNRPAPAITASAMVAVQGDPSLPDHAAILRTLTDVDGMFAIPREHAESAIVHGAPDRAAEYIATLADHGAQRVVVTIVAGDWFRQTELLARALSTEAL